MHLTTRKSFDVEIGRARDRAEWVTDDAEALREQLEPVTGDRLAAFEGLNQRLKQSKRGNRRPCLDNLMARTAAGSGRPILHRTS